MKIEKVSWQDPGWTQIKIVEIRIISSGDRIINLRNYTVQNSFFKR